jgi:hypothetical protein
VLTRGSTETMHNTLTSLLQLSCQLTQLCRLSFGPWENSCAQPFPCKKGAMQVLQQQQRCSRPLTQPAARQQQLVVASIPPRSPSAVAAVASCRATAAAGIGSSSRSSSTSSTQRQQHQQLQRSSSGRGSVVASAAAAATSSLDLEELIGPTALEPEVFEIVTYALKLAWTSETYYVHSWMVLLGLLKKENSIACEVRGSSSSSSTSLELLPEAGTCGVCPPVCMLPQQPRSSCLVSSDHSTHPPHARPRLPTIHPIAVRSCVSWAWTTSMAPGTRCCGRSTCLTASPPGPSHPTCSGASAPASSCRQVSWVTVPVSLCLLHT